MACDVFVQSRSRNEWQQPFNGIQHVLSFVFRNKAKPSTIGEAVTSWLDFREEPIIEDDFTIDLILPPGEQSYIQCSCGFIEGVTNEGDAEDSKYHHAKWHEEGCPE